MVYQIGSKQAYIFNNNIGVSYNTPIVYSAGGVSFVTENYYSNTTAHHKRDILNFFNNSQEVEVQQAALIDLINQDLDPAAVIKEQDLKSGIIAAVGDNSWIYKNKKAAKYINLENETRNDFKNGNYETIRTYKTSFKYVSNIGIKQTRHAFRQTRPAFNGPTGPKPEAHYYTYKNREVLTY